MDIFVVTNSRGEMLKRGKVASYTRSASAAEIFHSERLAIRTMHRVAGDGVLSFSGLMDLTLYARALRAELSLTTALERS